MAEITLQRLETTDMQSYPSNTLLDYYDIIHKLAEALAIREGVKIKGDGAHQELIDFLARELMIDEQARQFLQQMREYRNRISYEGFMVHANYIDLNDEMILKIINHLFELLKG